MNLKDFFYKDYFTKRFTFTENNGTQVRAVDLRKPTNEEDFKVIKKQNTPVFVAANNILKEHRLQPNDFGLLNLSLPLRLALNKIELTTIYPGLILGTGYTHETNNEAEFKLGFYFDHTTGLPCIPGSSIKGTLRSVFPQFKNKHPFKPLPTALQEEQQSKIEYISGLLDWKNDDKKSEKIHQLELAIFEGVDLRKTKMRQDAGKDDIEYKSTYYRFLFYHACIIKAPDRKIFEIDTITPHGTDPLKNPIPLNFLKIRPGVTFNAQFILQDIDFLGVEKEDIKNLFHTVLHDIGLGAKTNVGYGQFKP